MKTGTTTSPAPELLRHARVFVGALLLGAILTLGLRAALAPDGAPDGAHGEAHAGSSHAAHTGHHHSTPPASDQGSGLLVDLANETCPVMGNPVSGHAFSEWNGLRIGYCCPGCDEQLAEDPEGFLDDAAPGWRDALAAVERVRAAKGSERESALQELRANYDLIREPAGTHDDRDAHGGGHEHD